MAEQLRARAAVFAQRAEEMSATAPPAETAEQVVAVTASELEADHVGLTMFRGKADCETVAATSDLPDRAAQMPGDGPYRDPRWRRQELLVDLRWDQRWPEWSTAVHELGLRNLLAVELTAEGRRVGVLCAFSEQQREYSDDDVAFAHIFARHAALALQAADLHAHLQVALDGRKLIGQAQGILMERYGLDDSQAFSFLQRLSQTNNRKLRDIAADLVRTRQLPTDPTVEVNEPL